MKKIVIFLLILPFLLGCGKENSEQIGVFSVIYKDGYKEITDGIGRKIILVKKLLKCTTI